jgi:hypothetical protein
MPKFTPQDLENKSFEELSTLGERNHPLSAEGILLEKEWQRRLMMEQYKLNRKVALIAAIFSGLFGLIGVLIGKYI